MLVFIGQLIGNNFREGYIARLSVQASVTKPLSVIRQKRMFLSADEMV